MVFELGSDSATAGADHDKANDRTPTIYQAAALAGATVGLTSSRRARVLGANDRVRLDYRLRARGQKDLREILKIPNGDFVAAADVTPVVTKSQTAAPAVKTFTDHRRLLDLKDLDAVIVASPLHCHGRHFIDTIAAGKDLYSEKTMTWSIEEAEACRKRRCAVGSRCSDRAASTRARARSPMPGNGSRAAWPQDYARRILDEP